MKTTLTVFVAAFFLFVSRCFAQDIVITEIMYNDPSTGAAGDSLEFIEIYNNSGDPFDITSYQIAGAIAFTFPSFTIQPGAYQIIARNSVASESFYSIAGTFQWTTGMSLANTQGDVILKTNLGVTVDSVHYTPNAPWPLSAAGNGSSIMLCDPFSDNSIGSNWTASGILNASTYGLVNGAPVYASPGNGCNTFIPYNPVFAPIPYSQGFDSVWVNAEGLRDVPDYFWKNSPAMGNNSFRRIDDGHSGAGWNTVTGAYTPTGASGTSGSARFHSSGTALSGTLDLYLDFSVPGLKRLKFWYNNTSGSDSLALYISFDNGTNFSYLTKYTTVNAWQQEILDLGTSVSATTILRFKATGTTVAGGTDLGLDGVDIYLAPDNDAGILAITEPPAAMSSLTNDVRITLANFGNADLTAVTINWEVNGIPQPVVSWNGNISHYSSETDVLLGNMIFPAGVTSVIRAWTSMPNGLADGDNNNDTAVASVYYQPYATIPFYEGFDSLWMNKGDSNDVPGVYWKGEPVSGNASWRRNDDGASAGWTNVNNGAFNPAGAYNTVHSARFHTASAANGATGELYCYLDLTPPGFKELRFSYINTSGNDSLAVWISYDGGSTFTFLQKFTNSTTWAQQMVQLGDSTSPNGVLRFRATRYGGGGIQSDIGLDEVSVGFAQPDVGIAGVIAPVSGCGHTSNEMVRVTVGNFGFVPVTDIPITVIHNGDTLSETALVTLQPGESFDYTFNAMLDLSSAGSTVIQYYISYQNDYNALNDSLTQVVDNINEINTFPFLEDFENGSTAYIILQGASNASTYVDSLIGINNSHALRMTGGAVAGTWPGGSGNTTTAAQAWTYTDHHATAATCLVDATNLSNPELKISLRQLHITNGGPRYSFFRVLINDTIPVASEGGVTDFNPATATADPYAMQVFDLSAFGNSMFKITLQSACKYAPGGNYGLGDNAFVDNFIIDEKPDYEVGVVAITSPFSGCDLSASEQITISVINNGILPASDFPVSIQVDSATWITETFSTLVPPDSTATYTFNATFDLSAFGPHTVIVATSLAGDPDHTNDTLHTSVSTVPYIDSYPAFQDFEGSFTGWSSGAISGQDIWELGTPAKTNLNYAFSGSKAWVTSLTANYENNSNIFVASPCYNFTSLTHPYLSVWLNYRTQNNVDAMILEASVNDSAWYKVPTDTLFYNNYSAQPPVTPPKWSGASNGYLYYATGLENLAGKEKVRFRFRFQSDANTVNEGFCIDDFNIKQAVADIQCYGWVSPTASCSFSNAELITMRLYNPGQLTLSELPVAYSINNGASFVYDTIHDPIPPMTQYMFTFSQPADLSTGAPFFCIVKAILDNDPTPLNNVASYTLNTLPPITSIPFVEDFEVLTNDYFGFTNGSNASVQVMPAIGLGASNGLQFTGLVAGTWPGGSGNTTTAAQAFGYVDHVSTASTCGISVSGMTGLLLKLALRQTYSTGAKYSYFRVMLNDSIQLADTTGVADYNPVTPDNDVYAWKVFDITPYMNDPFTISLQASCKYDDANATTGIGDKALVDSVMLFEPTVVGVQETEHNHMITYPNPTSGKLRVDFGRALEKGELSLVDAMGKLVMIVKLENSTGLDLDLGDLTEGVYCLKVIYDNHILIQRIVKE